MSGLLEAAWERIAERAKSRDPAVYSLLERLAEQLRTERNEAEMRVARIESCAHNLYEIGDRNDEAHAVIRSVMRDHLFFARKEAAAVTGELARIRRLLAESHEPDDVFTTSPQLVREYHLRGSVGSSSDLTISGHAPHRPHPAYSDKSPHTP